MEEKEFDVVVIGSGPGGYVAAIRSARLGLKTACVEKNDTLGGTCLNVGCIPSKTLLHTSDSYEFIKNDAGKLGINAGDVSYYLDKIMDNKVAVVKGLTDGIASLLKKNNVERIVGFAKFLDAHTLSIANGSQTIEIKAKNFIIATGSIPIELPFMPFDGKQIISSTEVLSLKEVPKKMIVIGAGVIGVELASVYRRLGAEIHIIEMLPDICVNMDLTIRKQLQRELTKQGIQFHLSAKVKSAKKETTGITVEYEQSGENKKLLGDVVLVGVGRKPFTEGLGLEILNIQKSKTGTIIVDNQFRTSQSNIYAIGDVIDGPMLAHKASDEGESVAELIKGDSTCVNYIAIPSVIYTNPEAASVGLTEEEAKLLGLDIIVGQAFFRGNARARCIDQTEGLVKIIGDKKTDRLLGLHIIGSNASEMIGEGVIALNKKVTLKEIATSSHAHPTLSESIKESAMDALGYAFH